MLNQKGRIQRNEQAEDVDRLEPQNDDNDSEPEHDVANNNNNDDDSEHEQDVANNNNDDDSEPDQDQDLCRII